MKGAVGTEFEGEIKFTYGPYLYRGSQAKSFFLYNRVFSIIFVTTLLLLYLLDNIAKEKKKGGKIIDKEMMHPTCHCFVIHDKPFFHLFYNHGV